MLYYYNYTFKAYGGYGRGMRIKEVRLAETLESFSGGNKAMSIHKSELLLTLLTYFRFVII